MQQRLDQIEDEFETVKQLLMSAARYAESANEKIDTLAEKVDTLTTAQQRTQQQLDALSGSVEQLSSKVDEFVYQAQRLLTPLASRLTAVEGQGESLEAIARRLDRNFEEQRSQFQEFQRTTNAALERIDRVLDYLLRQSGSSGAGE